MARPGQIFAGRFEIERLAGSGGMASVFRALDRARGAPAAVKVLRTDGQEAVGRFAREAEILGELSHPGVVRYVAHGVTPDGDLFLAMEWLEGESLGERLAREGLTVREAVALVAAVAEAAGAAHARGLVHRDIKPSNIFLVDGAIERVKLIDFGIARAAGAAAQITRTGAMIGTPGYMAPEQVRASSAVDARADVFSLGCVLFKCLTGRAPFAGDDLLGTLLKAALESAPRVRDLAPAVPAPVDALVDRMLAREPERRPADGCAVAEALRALGVSGAEDAGPAGHTPALTTGERRVISFALAAQPSPGGAPAGGAETPSTRRGYEPARDVIAAAAAIHGCRADVFADGSIVVLPIEHGAATDQAVRVARAALALRRLLPAVVAIVVASGQGAVVGDAPSNGLVDRAAGMLRAAGRGGAVTIDELTAHLVEERFTLRREAGGLALIAERDSPDPARMLLGKPTPCVGRERDLGALLALFDESSEDSVARAVLVTAGPGMGKSRLCHELLRSLADRGRAVRVIAGRGDALRTAVPFGLLGPALLRAAGVEEADPPALRRDKLRALAARCGDEPERARVAEFLGELSGVPSAAEVSPQLAAAHADPIVMGDQVRRAFEDLLAAECAAGPVLLVLDDLQWADRPSVRHVDAALRLLHDQPLMVLAFARPDVSAVFPDLWEGRGLVRRELRGLSRAAVEELSRRVLGDRLSPAEVARLVARASGNALYVEELLRAQAEGRGDEPPETVLAMVQSRLAALHPEARRVLRAASVLGRTFSEAGVRALLGGDRMTAPLGDLLADLVDREILGRRAAGGRAYDFRHDLVREAAYAMLTDEDRTLGHRLAGAWLSREGAADAAVIADHLIRAGDLRPAVRWLRRAADQAFEGNDLAGVIAHAERAAACGAEGEELGAVRLRQAEAHGWLGQASQMEAYALEALELLPRGSALWCAAVTEASMALGRRGRPAHAVPLAEALLELLAAGETSRALCLSAAQVSLHMVLSRFDDLADRLAAGAEAAAGALIEDDVVLRARLYAARLHLALRAGRPGAVLDIGGALAAVLEDLGDIRLAARILLTVATGYKNVGDDAAAEPLLRRASALGERAGMRAIVAEAKHNLTHVLLRQGGCSEACVVGRDAADIYADAGNVRMERATRIYLALALLACGDVPAALEQALAAAEPIPALPQIRAHALAVVAQVHLAAGRAAEALAAAAEAERYVAGGGRLEEGEFLVSLSFIEGLFAAGEEARALAALAAARESVLSRGATIDDDTARARFFTGVPENARLLALARDRLGDAA